MEPYIQISQLNDFIFCPKSIYYHGLYGGYKSSVYHDTPQVTGKIKHESIDLKKYSSASRYIQGLEVYNSKYNICGKIDIYDIQTKSLIERKTKIKEIYDGQKYQLYGQYFCLQEMGYIVEHLYLHSLTDNKRYKIKIPNEEEIKKFENLINQFCSFDLFDSSFTQNINKCNHCIYNELCDTYLNKNNVILS